MERQSKSLMRIVATLVLEKVRLDVLQDWEENAASLVSRDTSARAVDASLLEGRGYGYCISEDLKEKIEVESPLAAVARATIERRTEKSIAAGEGPVKLEKRRGLALWSR